MIKDMITKTVEQHDMTEEEAYAVMKEIMEGEATDAQIGSALTALRLKGETIDEVTGFARAMREKAAHINPRREGVLDTCGTGGDGLKTFNISTLTAFVVAGAGVPVAKHGNRAVSSHCGSADILEALGAKIDLLPERVEKCIEDVGIGFLFAPNFHAAMKYAIGPRREIGIRTVFNILGPLTNPAGARIQLLGVYNAGLTSLMAEVLKNLGSVNVMVVHGASGMDEISSTGRNEVVELKDGTLTRYTLEPEDFGFQKAEVAELATSGKEENSRIFMRVIEGEKGVHRDITLMNCAGALKVAGLASSFEEGVAIAQESLDSGKAREKLKAFIEFTKG